MKMATIQQSDKWKILSKYWLEECKLPLKPVKKDATGYYYYYYFLFTFLGSIKCSRVVSKSCTHLQLAMSNFVRQRFFINTT